MDINAEAETCPINPTIDPNQECHCSASKNLIALQQDFHVLSLKLAALLEWVKAYEGKKEGFF